MARLGPSQPTWRALYVALAKLAGGCGGAFAFVLDEGNGLWCVGIAGELPTVSTQEEDRAADRFYRAEIVPRMSSMRKGIKLDVAKVEGDDRYLALSFAAIYAVVVWFDHDLGEREAAGARVKLRRALPEIEALTLALPPSDGPGTDEGAMKIRA
jgi:hypothetical protein